MIRADMIPDEVVEAAAKAAYENQRTRKWDRCGYVGQQQLRRDARAAIAAALNAWPGSCNVACTQTYCSSPCRRRRAMSEESPKGCTPEALIEAVTRLYEKKWGVRDYLLALDVIALIRPATLEEAAKVCDVIEDKLTEQWKAGYKVCDYTQGASDGANDCAAAIRALATDPGPGASNGS